MVPNPWVYDLSAQLQLPQEWEGGSGDPQLLLRQPYVENLYKGLEVHKFTNILEGTPNLVCINCGGKYYWSYKIYLALVHSVIVSSLLFGKF